MSNGRGDRRSERRGRPILLVLIAVLGGCVALPAGACDWTGEHGAGAARGDASGVCSGTLELTTHGFWRRLGRAAAGLDLALPVLVQAVGGAGEPDEDSAWTARGAVLAGALFSGMLRAAAEIGERWIPGGPGEGKEGGSGSWGGPSTTGPRSGRA